MTARVILMLASCGIGAGAVLAVAVLHDLYYEHAFWQQDAAFQEALAAKDFDNQLRTLINMKKYTCGKWLSPRRYCQ